MTSEHTKWDKLKNNYLKQVEQALASTNHPKSSDVLRDVDEHLDRKYAELKPDKQNWEGYQQILIEMGPPDDYAELLTEEKLPAAKTSFGVNGFLAVMFIIVLAIVGSYLIYTARNVPLPPDVIDQQPVVFSEDLPAVGIAINQSHCTADFVQSLLGTPKRIDSNGRMLRYTEKGIDFWFSGNEHLSEVHLNQGFEGTLDTGISLASSRDDVFRAYGKPIQKIDASDLHRRNDERILYQKGNASRIYYGSRGLIFWFKNDAIAQIVVFKGHLTGPKTAAKPFVFELDERVLGKWVTIDFVKTIDDFDPGQKHWAGGLFLQSLEFQDNGKVRWRAEKREPVTLDWTKGVLGPLDERASFYYLRNINGQIYLFMEWNSGDVTIRGEEPWYYVLKRAGEKRPNNPMGDSNQDDHKTVQGNVLPVSGKITFIRWRSLNQPDCVEQIDLASGEIKQVVQASPERPSIRSFCFSPDKKQFLFEMGSGENWYENNEIYIGNSGGEHVRQITNNEVYDGDPTWSLDGKRMAFTRGLGAKGCVYLRDLESGEEQPLLIPELIISRNPHWLTEESLVVIGFDTEKRQGLVDFDIKNGNSRWLLKDQVDYLCLSPDRKRLACVVQKRNETPQIIQQVMKESDWLYSVNILTLATAQLNPLNDKQTAFEKDTCPLWSHDGEKLAWIRNNSLNNNCKLLIYDIEKESTRVIPLSDEKAVSLMWAPDDSRIACVSCDQKETKYNLRLFLLTAGTRENIFSSENRIQCCDWE